jgi:hypothetical protein
MKQSVNQRWKFWIRREKIRRRKMVNLVFLISPLILLIVWWRGCVELEKRAVIKCEEEYNLSFAGVISNYQTNILAERSTFMLNDSIEITIPRSKKEVFVSNGDTIVKERGTHSYLVRWRYPSTAQRVFTFTMRCRD